MGVRKRIEMEKREVGAKMEAMMVRVINLLGEKWRVVKYMRTWRKKWEKLRVWGKTKKMEPVQLCGRGFQYENGRSRREAEEEQGEERVSAPKTRR